MNIRLLSSESEVEECAGLLRESFATVAREYALTEDLVPTNAAFTTPARLRLFLKRRAELHGLYAGEDLIGCVAIERARGNDRDFYIEKLAVSPAHRQQGHGTRLLTYACDLIRSGGGARALLGMMDSNTVLKAWYKSRGFKQVECRTFSHLPFRVCTMTKDLPLSGSPAV